MAVLIFLWDKPLVSGYVVSYIGIISFELINWIWSGWIICHFLPFFVNSPLIIISFSFTKFLENQVLLTLKYIISNIWLLTSIETIDILGLL